MSDTPRTDAETGDGQGKAGRVFVKAEFARSLERELADTKEQLRDATNDAEQYFKDNVKLIAECEVLRAQTNPPEIPDSSIAAQEKLLSRNQLQRYVEALTDIIIDEVGDSELGYVVDRRTIASPEQRAKALRKILAENE